jgi:hypothetical protein
MIKESLTCLNISVPVHFSLLSQFPKHAGTSQDGSYQVSVLIHLNIFHGYCGCKSETSFSFSSGMILSESFGVVNTSWPAVPAANDKSVWGISGMITCRGKLWSMEKILPHCHFVLDISLICDNSVTTQNL